ncbi:MAG: TonB-dependent receptor, partial [Flavobacterium stagni]
EQYLNNLETPEARLPDYVVNDFNVSVTWTPKKVFQSITVNGLVNNVLNKQYISNGYMYDIYPYYYPQAGRNFLVGLTLKF